MFETIRAAMDAVLTNHPWSQELAVILPLSALIDFLDVPRTFHTFQLTRNVPLWCWSITPSASRLLLARRKAEDSCYLDHFGASLSPICLDGRYGDLYQMASPETLRLYLETLIVTKIPNDHENMQRDEKRFQNLEVIHVSRAKKPSRSRRSLRFLAADLIGWGFFLCLFTLTALLKFYMALGFMATLLLSGVAISLVHGGERRKFPVERGSKYNRVVVAALHMNETNWQVFYGESSIVNSVLNRSLPSNNHSNTMPWLLRPTLRGLILCQWGFAIGAAAIKGWDAYFITLWIMFCIFSQGYLFSPEHVVKDWMEAYAGVRMDRYQAQFGSRRALLNTIIALNPDTFSFDEATNEDSTAFYAGAFKWIDPILREGPDRTQWEEATRLAMIEAKSPPDDTSTLVSENISEPKMDSSARKESKHIEKTKYWHAFIPEGIEMAEKIRQIANLSGRYVSEKRDELS